MNSSGPMVLNEEQAIELLAFLVTAARIQLDEPASYGPMRLLTAANRLSSFIEISTAPDTRAFLAGFTADIEGVQDLVPGSESYLAAVDGLCRSIAEHLVARSGLKDGAR